jgi:REP element-mobilizing transposase RayT
MANSYTQLNVHITFHIKTGTVPIVPADLPRLFSYLGGCASEQGAKAIVVGGMPDHIHMLVSIPATITISELIKNIKVWSSKWLKTQDSAYRGFAWQDGYGAFSVSHSVISKTISYIANQAEHHKKISFREEYISFLKANGIAYDEKYL